MPSGNLRNQLRTFICRSVDTHLVGSYTQELRDLVNVPNSSSDGKRYMAVLAEIFDRLKVKLVTRLVSGDIDKDQFIDLPGCIHSHGRQYRPYPAPTVETDSLYQAELLP